VQSGNIGRLPYLAGPIHLLFGESAYRRRQRPLVRLWH
jgi:hypothetical protein